MPKPRRVQYLIAVHPKYETTLKVAGERVGLRVPGDFAVRFQPRNFLGSTQMETWVVDDCETGAAVAEGSTRKQAIINARKRVVEHGEAGFTKARTAFLKWRQWQVHDGL